MSFQRERGNEGTAAVRESLQDALWKLFQMRTGSLTGSKSTRRQNLSTIEQYLNALQHVCVGGIPPRVSRRETSMMNKWM